MKPVIFHNLNFTYFDAEKDVAYYINELSDYRRLSYLAKQNPKFLCMVEDFEKMVSRAEKWLKEKYIGNKKPPLILADYNMN